MLFEIHFWSANPAKMVAFYRMLLRMMGCCVAEATTDEGTFLRGSGMDVVLVFRGRGAMAVPGSKDYRFATANVVLTYYALIAQGGRRRVVPDKDGNEASVTDPDGNSIILARQSLRPLATLPAPATAHGVGP